MSQEQMQPEETECAGGLPERKPAGRVRGDAPTAERTGAAWGNGETDSEARAEFIRNRSGRQSKHSRMLAFTVLLPLAVLVLGAVLYGRLSLDLLVLFLMLMTGIQAVMQLAYRMHMKDRGYASSIVSLIFGSIVTLAAVVAAVYWVWI